jgi:hypothetical protein
MSEWVCFLLLHNLLSSPKIMQPLQYVPTFCPHSSAARARVWRSKTKPLPSSRGEKKGKEKNSYMTHGIKGLVYSLQVALSGGTTYKESYLVTFSVKQTCSRPGSFWCGRKYSFYKQGHVFGFVHRPLFSYPDTQAFTHSCHCQGGS